MVPFRLFDRKIGRDWTLRVISWSFLDFALLVSDSISFKLR